MEIIKLAFLAIAFFVFIYAVTRTEDVEYDYSECDRCPFPRCENSYGKELTKARLRKMDGQTVMIQMKTSSFPVTVSVREDDLWVVNQSGSSTTYDDVKKSGGKFFEKIANKA